MPRLIFVGLAIFAIPFVLYLAWAWIGRRRGRAMGPPPFAWLIVSGVLLTAGWLIIGGAFNSGGTGRYVPAQAQPDGSVKPGYYEEGRPSEP